MQVESISVAGARTLFLHAQGMLDSIGRAATPGATLREIRRLGFVQLDSINIVERAHHHILFTRLHEYKPAVLDKLQRSGKVFEHWTHDASYIPSEWFPHWRHRFSRFEWSSWLKSRVGPDPTGTVNAVLHRIRQEGPLRARDFEHAGLRAGTWWDWKPSKAALEYLWRRGELAIPRRHRFEKFYDLTERVLPTVHGLPPPEAEVHLDWACRAALERLGVATTKEIAAFWNLHTRDDVAKWCAAAAGRGEIVPVRMEPAAGAPSSKQFSVSYAYPDWRKRLADAPAPPEVVRVLSPFDPVVRDRARALRLFNFDYRFEAFVPEAKRTYGYYVLPIMDGSRFVGRLDPKLSRQDGALHVRRVWWEPGVKPTKRLTARLEESLHIYAAFAGADTVVFETKGRPV